MSPALGNDCDVDNQVKKPLLHDMFDLLGLPMCNTGLSLFRMACRSATGPRFGGGGAGCGRPSALAAAATEKWMLKRKTNHGSDRNDQNNQNNQNNNNSSKKDCGTTAAIVTLRPPARASRQSSLYCAGKQRGGGTVHSRTVSPAWGNGRDWTRPVDSEGDWVRVFPFVPATMAARSPQPRSGKGGVRASASPQQFARPASSAVSADEKNTTARAMIKHVQEYLRSCKKVAKSCEGLTAAPDDELNDKLRDLLPAVTKTWLPPN